MSIKYFIILLDIDLLVSLKDPLYYARLIFWHYIHLVCHNRYSNWRRGQFVVLPKRQDMVPFVTDGIEFGPQNRAVRTKRRTVKAVDTSYLPRAII